MESPDIFKCQVYPPLTEAESLPALRGTYRKMYCAFANARAFLCIGVCCSAICLPPHKAKGGIAMSCLDEQDKITAETEPVLPEGAHDVKPDEGHEHPDHHEHPHHHGPEDDGHEHHEHPHRHGHHTHDVPQDGNTDRTLILLRYMYDHNMHHAEELIDLAAALRTEGREKAAELIDEALNAYRSGNELLSKALGECGE